MHHSFTASGRWMTTLAQLLRPRSRTAPASQSAAIAPLPTAMASGFPVGPALRPTRIAATRTAGTHVPRRALRSPLRVIRIVEAGQASAQAGRILMSGRMADVCAELDRMVEREAALRPGI